MELWRHFLPDLESLKRIEHAQNNVDDTEKWSRLHGKRPVERPKQRWMDNIEKDLKRASLSLYGITTERNQVRLEELVGDRERWKDITAASMSGRGAYRMTTWPEIYPVRAWLAKLMKSFRMSPCTDAVLQRPRYSNAGKQVRPVMRQLYNSVL